MSGHFSQGPRSDRFFSQKEEKAGMVASAMIFGLLRQNYPFISEQELTNLTLMIQNQDSARNNSHGITKGGPGELQQGQTSCAPGPAFIKRTGFTSNRAPEQHHK